MAHSSYSIRTRNLKKSFKNVNALDGLSLFFPTGVMHGVIGPEGAGKTTLMRILLGLLTPSEGNIEYQRDGVALAFEDIRESVAYMPQQQSLYPDLSINEHLEFFKELYGISKSAYVQKRDELLQITRLSAFTDRLCGQLSGGMYKKLGLMCALLRSPDIVLLDEPTNGVDPISRREFWDLLYHLADQNILIILTTSYMDEAERCGHVHLMEKGKLVAEGEPRHLLQETGARSFDDLFLARGSS
jgi:ABC-2 type transport system ATP-binding protein